jgi:hypothetical protein
MSEPLPAITDAGARALAEKLAAFSATLTPPEQALLVATFARAAGVTDDDVQGFLGGLGPINLNQAPISMSFNMQFLMMQSTMQSENREYTAVSNIMKTKHNTAQDSIGNVR